jgi:hypothetical protein
MAEQLRMGTAGYLNNRLYRVVSALILPLVRCQ